MTTQRLRTLETSRNSKVMQGLSSIQNTSNKKSSFQRILDNSVLCAYHSGEKITNFCRSKNCLLPLCPKCVKIHADEHQRMGSCGDFQVLQSCFQEVQKNHYTTLKTLSRMIQYSQQLQSTHDYKIFCARRELQQAKQQVLLYISNIFTSYERAIDACLLKQNTLFTNQIMTFHNHLNGLVQEQKNRMRKISNKHLQMEFLIQSYSRTDISILMENCQQTLKTMAPQYITLETKIYELSRLQTVIKRYLDFGQFNSIIQERVDQNKVTEVIYNYELSNQKNLSPFKLLQQLQNSRANLQKSRTNLYKSRTKGSNQQKVQIKVASSSIHHQSPQKLQLSRQYFGNDISKYINKQSKLSSFESPLDAYSLQKSRQERKMKRNQNQMQ